MLPLAPITFAPQQQAFAAEIAAGKTNLAWSHFASMGFHLTILGSKPSYLSPVVWALINGQVTLAEKMVRDETIRHAWVNPPVNRTDLSQVFQIPQLPAGVRVNLLALALLLKQPHFAATINQDNERTPEISEATATRGILHTNQRLAELGLPTFTPEVCTTFIIDLGFAKPEHELGFYANYYSAYRAGLLDYKLLTPYYESLRKFEFSKELLIAAAQAKVRQQMEVHRDQTH